jgi:hypothetical protein
MSKSFLNGIRERRADQRGEIVTIFRQPTVFS